MAQCRNDGSMLGVAFTEIEGAKAWQSGLPADAVPEFRNLAFTMAWWSGWARACAEFFPDVWASGTGV